jgi:putative methionine-R-sulfoxide reductase with GAF domain
MVAPMSGPAASPEHHRFAGDWDAFLRDVLGRFGCQTGTLHWTADSGDELELAAQVGVPDALLAVIGRIPFGKGIAGAAAATRQPVEMCNLQTDASGVARPAAKQTGVAGSLAVPVIAPDGRVVGTLGIGKPEPYEFSDEEKAKLAAVAAELAARITAAP